MLSTCASLSVAIYNLFAIFFLLNHAAELHDWASKPLPAFFSQHSVLEIGNIFLQLYYRVALELHCFSDIVQHFASVLLLSFAQTSLLFMGSLDTSFQWRVQPVVKRENN